jgi:hypothetical protein
MADPAGRDGELGVELPGGVGDQQPRHPPGPAGLGGVTVTISAVPGGTRMVTSTTATSPYRRHR